MPRPRSPRGRYIGRMALMGVDGGSPHLGPGDDIAITPLHPQARLLCVSRPLVEGGFLLPPCLASNQPVATATTQTFRVIQRREKIHPEGALARGGLTHQKLGYSRSACHPRALVRTVWAPGHTPGSCVSEAQPAAPEGSTVNLDPEGRCGTPAGDSPTFPPCSKANPVALRRRCGGGAGPSPQPATERGEWKETNVTMSEKGEWCVLGK